MKKIEVTYIVDSKPVVEEFECIDDIKVSPPFFRFILEEQEVMISVNDIVKIVQERSRIEIQPPQLVS